MGELESLLAKDAVSTADGGGKTTAARRPILGRAKVARYLSGTAWEHLRYEQAEVNGQPGILGVRDGTVLGLLVATFVARRLSHSAALPGQEG